MKAIKTAGSKAEKKLMRFAVLFTVLALLGSTVDAQIDPSSAMLLNSNSANVRDGGLDSGRYTVKPRSETIHTTTVRKSDVRTRVEETSVAAPSPTPAPTATPSNTAVQAETLSPTSSAGPAVPPAIPPATPAAQTVNQGPQSTTFGPQEGPQESGDDDAPVVAKVPRDERRFTMLELSFAPGYLYNDSQSSFAPRNYFVNAPSMSVDASVWTSPNFGLHTSFNGTLNANVTDSLNNTRNAALSEQWFSVGARVRRFFGEGPLAPALQLGLDYREFEFNVPSDTVMRNKLTTTGLLLLLDADIPTSNFGAWVFGGEIGPKLSHHESSNAVEFRSGDDPQTTSVGVHLGARYRFDHTQQMFWKISYGVEKNLYSGSTTINDPITGLPQTNVSVTDSFTLFQLGYSWSN